MRKTQTITKGENKMLNLLNSFAIRFSMLGADWEDALDAAGYGWLKEVFNGLTNFLVPLLIAVATAGMVYAIYLGINLVRAEDQSKREEAKKRLIWAIIGIVVMVAGIALLYILRNNIASIMGLVQGN